MKEEQGISKSSHNKIMSYNITTPKNINEPDSLKRSWKLLDIVDDWVNFRRKNTMHEVECVNDYLIVPFNPNILENSLNS